MLRKQYCICLCYYEKNLYLKEYDLHFTFKNRSQFRKEYLHILEYMSQNEINVIEEKLEEEVKRRKEQILDSFQRRRLIKETYTPLHPQIFSLSKSYLTPQLLRIAESTEEQAILSQVEKHNGGLYSMPVFSPHFCDKFIEEVKHFENSSLPKQRPNSMNKYGVNVDELGLEPFITDLRVNYLKPLTRLLFPEWGGESLDSHKAFVVKYKKGEDLNLGYHYDNAEVTLNISLNDDFGCGELFFGPMRFDDSSLRFGYEHVKGRGVLHRGQQMHGAFSIDKGERYNLIIWMRSSEVRNLRCPMCDETPSLEPVKEGTGDGFAMTVQDLCSVV